MSSGRSDLLAALKVELGYTDEVALRCDQCRHSKEEEEDERSWRLLCDLFKDPLLRFEVCRQGRCSRFMPKEK